jgi:hypothetical protein
MSIELFPVVHLTDSHVSIEQVRKAFELEADGVFLIDHLNFDGTDHLLDIYNSARQEFPGKFIGINVLQLIFPVDSLHLFIETLDNGQIDKLPDALWYDDASVDKGAAIDYRTLHPSLVDVQLFGGTAFKYTSSYTDDPTESAIETTRIAPSVDVVTTSGKGTGFAPSTSKLASMKAASGGRPLAVASGISVENLDDYRGVVDKILVSSSIETPIRTI